MVIQDCPYADCDVLHGDAVGRAQEGLDGENEEPDDTTGDVTVKLAAGADKVRNKWRK